MTVNLRLDIKPEALPRARHSAKDNIVRSYYNRKTLSKFDTYTDALNQAIKRLDIETRYNIRGMVEKAPERLGITLYVIFRMPIPKSTSNKRKIELEMQPHLLKPDTDNLLKMILDRAEGILFDNDKRIYSIKAEKIYSERVGIDLTLNYDILWKEKDMGDVEFGKCDICGKETTLNRKYYHYDIKCDCCSPKHFEIVRHCKDCKPQPPKYVKVYIKPIDE